METDPSIDWFSLIESNTESERKFAINSFLIRLIFVLTEVVNYVQRETSAWCFASIVVKLSSFLRCIYLCYQYRSMRRIVIKWSRTTNALMNEMKWFVMNITIVIFSLEWT